jgi:hypothetical protein
VGLPDLPHHPAGRSRDARRSPLPGQVRRLLGAVLPEGAVPDPAGAVLSLERIGHEILGPAFCVHLQRTVEIARERAIERIYFLARDGKLLVDLHPAIARALGDERPASYLHVSRRSTALASAHGFGAREIALASSDGKPAIEEMLRSFDLADPEALAVARGGIASPGFQALVRDRAEAARRRLRRYLDAQGFTAARSVALVDVGWSGSIQSHLARALDGGPSLHGIYLGLYAAGEDRQATVFDGRKRSLTDWAPRQFVQIFEQAGRSDEGTVLGYDDEGRPRFGEAAPLGAVADLQGGVRAAVEAHAHLLAEGRAPPLAELRELARARVRRFVFQPTRDQIEAVAALAHVEDWAGSGAQPLAAAPPPLTAPRRWLDGFYAARWKPAYLRATAGGAPLAAAFAAWEALKLRLRR